MRKHKRIASFAKANDFNKSAISSINLIDIKP